MDGRFVTCSLRSGVHFASGATRTTSQQLDHAFWELLSELVFSLTLRTFTRVRFLPERGRESQRDNALLMT